MSSPPFELKSSILRAGAGAGKTTRLVSEFFSFCQNFRSNHQDRWPRIVVTTFTRKATHELKERLLSHAMEKHDFETFEFVGRESQVHISTIHGVLVVFLRRFSKRIGLSPDFRFVSKSEVLKSKKTLLKTIIAEKPDFLKLLEDYQLKELLQALTMKFEMEFSQGELRPLSLAELIESTDSLIQKLCDQVTMSSQKILLENPPDSWTNYLNLTLNLKSQGHESFFSKTSELKEKLSLLGRRPSFSSKKPPFEEALRDSWKSALEDLENFLESFEADEEFWKLFFENQKLFDELSKEFNRQWLNLKIETAALEMSDIELLCAKIFREAPECSLIFSLEWDYWMIDEYQDTSPLQVQLLEKLIHDRPQFVVGDPQQSIYLFRGARSEVFEGKKQQMLERGGISSEQMENYRSRAPLLHLINFVFTRLKSSQPSQFQAMTAKKDWPSLHPTCDLLTAQTQGLKGEEVRELESDLALFRLQELLAEGVPADRICVLSRTNQRLEDLAVKAKTAGVPVQLTSPGREDERAEIRDALCLLQFLVNPHDNFNFVALTRSPWLKLEDEDLVKICQGKEKSFWKNAREFLKHEGYLSSESHRLLQFLIEVRQRCEVQGYFQSLVELMETRGIFDSVHEIDPSGRREAQLWKFLSQMKSREREGKAQWLEFIRDFESEDSESSQVEAVPVVLPERVNLMTIHASKGLQFDHVVILGLSQDLQKSRTPLWSFNEKESRWSLAARTANEQNWVYTTTAQQQTRALNLREELESERLLYVAFTRAKESLSLILNDKPRPQSWIQKWPLPWNEGVHEQENFSYRVRCFSQSPVLEKKRFESKEKTSLREKLKFASTSLSNSPMAVTQWLQSHSTFEATSMERSLDQFKKVQLGIDFHRLFEALRYQSWSQAQALFSGAEQKKALQFLRELKSPPFEAIVRSGFAEYGFEVHNPEFSMRGQIDLWAEVGDEVWVLDYKTGSLRYKEKAFLQLSAYALSLQLIHSWTSKKISLAVVYPLEEKVFIESFNKEKFLEHIAQTKSSL